MSLDRRHCLGLLLGAGAGLFAGRANAVGASSERLCLTARRRAGRFELALIDARSGQDLRVLSLPGRGHSFALDRHQGKAVAFARQAGFFAVALDLHGAGAPQIFEPAPGRHFYGHGVHVDAGHLLVTTENDYEIGRGVLGVYDASPGGNYRRIGEFESGGVGPHEVIVLPDAHTLCVANGGVLTHPDYGKLALNLDSMCSSLAYVDARTGELLEQHSLPSKLQRLSIRHLSLDASGAVWFGCQYLGAAADRPALVGRHRRGGELTLYAGPAEVLRILNNYIGSVSANSRGDTIATSSPVGGCVAYWDAASGRCLGNTALPDVCGLAPTADGGFLLSSGQGSLVHAAPDRAPLVLRADSADLAWDNHLS